MKGDGTHRRLTQDQSIRALTGSPTVFLIASDPNPPQPSSRIDDESFLDAPLTAKCLPADRVAHGRQGDAHRSRTPPPGGRTSCRAVHTSMGHARTLIAHEHALFVSGLERLLAPECDIVGAIHRLQLLPDAVRRLRPDLVLQDLSTAPSVGLQIITDILQSTPHTRILVLTMWAERALVTEALRRGASAYVHLTASTAELLEGIRHVLIGRRYVTSPLATAAIDSLATLAAILTPRQIAVVRLLAQGKSMKEVGFVLGMSQRTVAFHKYNVMHRCNMGSSAELVRFAVEHDLV